MKSSSAGKIKIFQWVGSILFTALTLFLLFYRLDHFPTLWWDEGWTLNVAQNWVLNDHFGHYLNGKEIPPSIVVRFTSVFPIALSFKIFGVGIWQGRLPGTIFTLFSLGLVYYITLNLYNKKIAIGSLFVLYFMSSFFFHPLLFGRQVLAEMPMLFFLFAGYTLFWLALTRSAWWIFIAGIFWGISLHSKIQVPPFLGFSFALALGFVLWGRQWKRAAIIMLGITCTLLTYWVITIVQNYFIPSSEFDLALWKLLFNTVVFVWDWSVRSNALSTTFVIGLPAMLGFLFGGWQIWRRLRNGKRAKIRKKSEGFQTIDMDSSLDISRDVLRLALWGLGASWFFWYMFLGLYWHRYLYPAFFIGSIFASEFLYHATERYDIRKTVLAASSLVRRLELKPRNWAALLVILLTYFSIGFGLLGFFTFGGTEQKSSLDQVTQYINKSLPNKALIETYDSELFFLAPHRYHFPSDLVSMQIVRKVIVDPDTPVDYNPLEANPDYLVLGEYNDYWGLYDEVLQSGIFELEMDFKDYQIYRNMKK